MKIFNVVVGEGEHSTAGLMEVDNIESAVENCKNRKVHDDFYIMAKCEEDAYANLCGENIGDRVSVLRNFDFLKA